MTYVITIINIRTGKGKVITTPDARKLERLANRLPADCQMLVNEITHDVPAQGKFETNDLLALY
jgi:hypothetical protein